MNTFLESYLMAISPRIIQFLQYFLALAYLVSFICLLVNPAPDYPGALMMFFNILLLTYTLLVRGQFGEYSSSMRNIQIDNQSQVENLSLKRNQKYERIENKNSQQYVGLELVSILFTLLSAVIHLIFNVILILSLLQPIFEVFLYPGGQNGEKFHTISHNGYETVMRSYCTGRNNYNQDMTKPIIIIEAGLGGSGHIHYEIQKAFDSDYMVCTYDRAGWGLSQQGEYPNSYQNMMEQMILTLKDGEDIPLLKPQKQIICIGHSLGGQLCQMYAKYLPSIKSIVTFDTFPIQKIIHLINLANGMTKEESTEDIQSSIAETRILTLLTPLTFVTYVAYQQYYQPNAAFHMTQVFWQYTTARQQYAELMFNIYDAASCDIECALLSAPPNQISVPSLIVSASNPNEGCQEAGITLGTKECDIFIIDRDTSLLIQNQMAAYTSGWSKIEYCVGLCDHDFAFNKAAFAIYTIKNNLANLL
eukprot:403353722